MRKVALNLSLVSLLAASVSCAAVFSNPPEWKLDFGERAIGHPAHLGSLEATQGILVTLHSGKVVLINPAGEKVLTMTLDLPCETPAVAGELLGKGLPSIVAVDVRGSIYCFNERGERRWKFPRAVKSGEFRLPVFADLDGDGEQEVIVTDSYGHLQALDASGRLRLEVAATKYRVSVPAVGDVTGDGKPEIIFGTEAGEVYCLNALGEVVWSTTLDACFGRAFPLVADADKDGGYQVYFPTAFNNAHPGLFALDARTGKFLWKAPSVLQSYRSTVVADLEGNGRNEILFGDKNSSLFCLDASGRQRWSTQLPGRGIFFAPAVADLGGNGAGTIFAVVRGAGSEGKSLYALDSGGHLLDALVLPGGGACSPVLCRFAGRSDVSLLALSAGGQLVCYRPEQVAGGANILWPGIRNDLANSGFVKSAKPRRPKARATDAKPVIAATRRTALAGSNQLQFPQSIPGAELLSVEVVAPDKCKRIDLIRLAPGMNETNVAFEAFAPGDYDMTLQWHKTEHNTILRSERYLYHLDQNYQADAARLAQVAAELERLGNEAPTTTALAAHFRQSASADFEKTRRTRSAAGFDALRQRCDYSLALIRYCHDRKFAGGVLLHQLANPWENFGATALFSQVVGAANSISVSLPGNSYESAAIALTNLKTNPATFRLSCGSFQAGTNQVAATSVLEFREVLSVRPDGSGPLTEDPLPLLGESQTVKLAPGETRKLWLTFRSQVMAAGTHRATLKIGDLAGPESPAEVSVTVEVSPVRLPERFTYRECNWLYLNSISDEALQDATMKDALEHGMNVFVIPSVSVPVDEQGNLGAANTEAPDKLVRKLRGRAFFLISGPVSVQWPAAAKPDAELRDRTFARALHWYADHMRSLGCDYDDYAIYLQDEPGLLGHDAGFDSFVALVKQFKAADSRMQLYANPAGGARVELLRPIQDLIDVWAPDLHLVREQPEELKNIFQRAKHYWHYEAPGDQRELDPLGFYRVKPWVAFQQGMTGGGYWVYSSSEFWSDNPAGGTEYGSVYPTDKGPVTTKRWEASREGIQDFELLWLVRKTAETSASPARKPALVLVDEAVNFVTQGQGTVTDISRHVRPYTPDYQKWMDYRRQLIQLQLRLTN
jgi:outer membrane protein assembly factor BamB